MQNLKILNKKEVKSLLSMINKQFGCSVDTDILDYVFLRNDKNKVFITNKKMNELDLTKLRINSMGLYIAEVREHEIRLSIEGSQIIGPYAKKNIIELDEEQARKWMKGEDLSAEGYAKEDYPGFVIIKHKDDYLGSGKYSNGRILNYVSKIRRVQLAEYSHDS